ncbi:hypothetical protein IMZ48_49875 [Candidatus Bathyarchaeota archaeon]|nr:hypothetical protein [Candidatus Bathyarchaeota archaeon]
MPGQNEKKMEPWPPGGLQAGTLMPGQVLARNNGDQPQVPQAGQAPVGNNGHHHQVPQAGANVPG